MVEWEDRHVFNQNRPELKLYRRFIDALLFIWEGSRESAVEFVQQLNLNTNNIVLDVSVNFLDLTFMKSEVGMSTKVYFKPTDRNSYLSIRS